MNTLPSSAVPNSNTSAMLRWPIFEAATASVRNRETASALAVRVRETTLRATGCW
jgi:hypothetical protein